MGLVRRSGERAAFAAGWIGAGLLAALPMSLPAMAGAHSDGCWDQARADGARAEIVGVQREILPHGYRWGHEFGQRRANPRIIVVTPSEGCADDLVTDVAVERLTDGPVAYDGAVGAPIVEMVKAIDRPAHSLGGHVRATPGLDGALVGTLDAGAHVRVTLNTGVWTEGYYWFRVDVDGRTVGYQWGGLLCVPGARVAGMRHCAY